MQNQLKQRLLYFSTQQTQEQTGGCDRNVSAVHLNFGHQEKQKRKEQTSKTQTDE